VRNDKSIGASLMGREVHKPLLKGSMSRNEASTERTGKKRGTGGCQNRDSEEAAPHGNRTADTVPLTFLQPLLGSKAARRTLVTRGDHFHQDREAKQRKFESGPSP